MSRSGTVVIGYNLIINWDMQCEIVFWMISSKVNSFSKPTKASMILCAIMLLFELPGRGQTIMNELNVNC